MVIVMLMRLRHSVKTRPHHIALTAWKRFSKTMNRYFMRCKSVKNPHFGPYEGISYGFNRYLGVMITALLLLPYHRSITAIATVTAFFTMI